MADNYLERKMDELRNRRPAKAVTRTAYPIASGKEPNSISLSIPGRRALVVGGASGIGITLTRAYIHAGCKVAVFDSPDSQGQQMAYSEGVRFHPVDLSDTASLCTAFATLLKAWRDIDIVILPTRPITTLTIDSCGEIARLWADHRRRFPIPSGYGFRLIVITTHTDNEPIKFLPLTSGNNNDGADITISCLHINPAGLADSTRLPLLNKAITDTCLFLSLPSTSSMTASLTLP